MEKNDQPSQSLSEAEEADLQQAVRISSQMQHQPPLEWPRFSAPQGGYVQPAKRVHPRMRPQNYLPCGMKLEDLDNQVESFRGYFSDEPVDVWDAMWLVEKHDGDVEEAVKEFRELIARWIRQGGQASFQFNTDDDDSFGSRRPILPTPEETRKAELPNVSRARLPPLSSQAVPEAVAEHIHPNPLLLSQTRLVIPWLQLHQLWILQSVSQTTIRINQSRRRRM